MRAVVVAVVLAAALLLGAAALVPGARGGWGSGACYPAGPVGPNVLSVSAPTPSIASYSWERTDSGMQWALMRGRHQAGVYVPAEQAYYPLLAPGVWGRAARPPIDPPPGCGCKGSGCKCDPEDCAETCKRTGKLCDQTCGCGAAQNFGMDYVPKQNAAPRYYINGHEVTKAEAYEAAWPPEVIGQPPSQKPNLIDDSAKGHIVVMGDKEKTGPVCADLRSNPRLVAILRGYHLKEYGPTHWKVKHTPELAALAGKPLVILKVQRDGSYDPDKDLWTEYKGADWLADEIERKHPPLPLPKVPTPDGPPSPLRRGCRSQLPLYLSLGLCLVAGVAAGYVFWRGRREPA